MNEQDTDLFGINEEMMNKYMVFEVDETYALELEKIIEIVEYKHITKVPETPPYVAGIMNLRGQAIPILDLRIRFKKPEREDLTRKCIIIIRFDEMQLGLIVDNVVDIITIHPDKISPPPHIGTDYVHVFIKEIGIQGNAMHLILDGDKLINYSDLEFLDRS